MSWPALVRETTNNNHHFLSSLHSTALVHSFDRLYIINEAAWANTHSRRNTGKWGHGKWYRKSLSNLKIVGGNFYPFFSSFSRQHWMNLKIKHTQCMSPLTYNPNLHVSYSHLISIHSTTHDTILIQIPRYLRFPREFHSIFHRNTLNITTAFLRFTHLDFDFVL